MDRRRHERRPERRSHLSSASSTDADDLVAAGTSLDHTRANCQSAACRGAARKRGVTGMTIKIAANDKGNPPGKLADAELHFTEGPLDGLKLIGFSIWERRGGNGGRNVTFPARQYSVNGERRSFPLLRPL